MLVSLAFPVLPFTLVSFAFPVLPFTFVSFAFPVLPFSLVSLAFAFPALAFVSFAFSTIAFVPFAPLPPVFVIIVIVVVDVVVTVLRFLRFALHPPPTFEGAFLFALVAPPFSGSGDVPTADLQVPSEPLEILDHGFHAARVGDRRGPFRDSVRGRR